VSDQTIPTDQSAIPTDIGEAVSLRKLLGKVAGGEGSILQDDNAVPTGFQPLDTVIGGGFRPGELVLLGGMPGVGKTILGLQWARAMALGGAPVVYACYEHDGADLLGRIVASEAGELEGTGDVKNEELRRRLRDAALTGGRGMKELLADPQVRVPVQRRLETYADNLNLVAASGRHTGLGELEELIDTHIAGRGVMVVDYLQKVALKRDVENESEKVTIITERLKELALRYQVPIINVVAAEKEGLKSPRLRLHHLRGSSALMYEADIALLMNDKFSVVAKAHRAYDPLTAAKFRNWVVFSIEKNRAGANGIDLEFEKDFAHFRFNPIGGVVSERLYSELDGDSE
jgi:replicative DNA helicase